MYNKKKSPAIVTALQTLAISKKARGYCVCPPSHPKQHSRDENHFRRLPSYAAASSSRLLQRTALQQHTVQPHLVRLGCGALSTTTGRHSDHDHTRRRRRSGHHPRGLGSLSRPQRMQRRCGRRCVDDDGASNQTTALYLLFFPLQLLGRWLVLLAALNLPARGSPTS